MNAKLTMLAVLAAGILFRPVQHVAAQANSPPDATATRPAKTPPDQTSMPNNSPPATTTQTTGQTSQDPVVKEMNEKEKGKVERGGQIARAGMAVARPVCKCCIFSAPEVGRTLLVEGQHAFAAVLGRNHAVVGLDLQRQPIAQ